MWAILFSLASYGAFWVQVNGENETMRTWALWISTYAAAIFGLWPIPVFYWDLPGWGVITLWLSLFTTIAVTVLYALLAPISLCFYGFFLVGVGFVTILNTFLWIGFGPSFKLGGLLYHFVFTGLYPVSFAQRDMEEGLYK